MYFRIITFKFIEANHFLGAKNLSRVVTFPTILTAIAGFYSGAYYGLSYGSDTAIYFGITSNGLTS
jgi:hypothetical protein